LIEQKQLRAKVSLAAFLKTTLLSPFFSRIYVMLYVA